MADTLAAMPMKPETARELSRAASQMEAFRKRRDEYIHLAYYEGAGLREIARVAGLTHRAVGLILRKVRPGGSDG